MGNAAGSDADCDDDEDAETKTDYEDFKKWLDKQEPYKPEGPPQAPAAPKAPVDLKLDVKWVCNICKMNAKQCHLSQLMSVVYWPKKIIIISSGSYLFFILEMENKKPWILDRDAGPTNANRLHNTLLRAKATARMRLHSSSAGLLRRRPSCSSLDGIGCMSVPFAMLK